MSSDDGGLQPSILSRRGVVFCHPSYGRQPSDLHGQTYESRQITAIEWWERRMPQRLSLCGGLRLPSTVSLKLAHRPDAPWRHLQTGQDPPLWSTRGSGAAHLMGDSGSSICHVGYVAVANMVGCHHRFPCSRRMPAFCLDRGCDSAGRTGLSDHFPVAVSRQAGVSDALLRRPHIGRSGRSLTPLVGT